MLTFHYSFLLQYLISSSVFTINLRQYYLVNIIHCIFPIRHCVVFTSRNLILFFFYIFHVSTQLLKIQAIVIKTVLMFLFASCNISFNSGFVSIGWYFPLFYRVAFFSLFALLVIFGMLDIVNSTLLSTECFVLYICELYSGMQFFGNTLILLCFV